METETGSEVLQSEMETEIPMDEQGEDYTEDDSATKLKLAVTSDEDSRESVKVSRQKELSLPKDTDSVVKDDTNNSAKTIPPVEQTSSKRKQSAVEWSSDEEDFAGFDECNGEPVGHNPFKKIKEELPSEGEDVDQKKQIRSENVDFKNTQVKEESDELGEENKPPDTEKHETVKPITKPPPEVKEKAPTPASDKPLTIKDPIYKKPFELGWKRELVYRAVPGVGKDKGEVYYITPTGKKIRTKSDIQLNLTSGLTIDNFTFAKEPIGMGPEEELIRSAKPISRAVPADVTLGKRIPKPKAPKGASPPPQGWTPVRAVKSSSNSSSPRPVSTPRVSDDLDAKTPISSNKSTAKSGKSQKKNSIANSSTLSLTTGDDTPVRKRTTGTRASKTGDNLAQTDTTNQQAQRLVPPISSVLMENFATNFFGNVSIGYDILLQTFQYLKVQELLRAACVCRVWNVVANHRSLWKTVRMKNSQVNDWTGLAAALKRNETKHLDLRKMISSTNGDEMWASFSKHIKTVESLETIDLCRCSAKIVESLFTSNPQLKVINAVTIKDDIMNFENIRCLENLQELRLKSIDGFSLEGDLQALRGLKNLKHLSLTSFRELGLKEIDVLGELTGLESLELGECSEFGINFATEVLPKLMSLERLRLEKGQDTCCTLEILEAIAQLPHLAQLELVNFDIKTGFDDKLSQCNNIKRLLLIPTYISQSATTNNIVLSAVLKLSDTLQILTWAVTLELLRVTALYVDQCDNKKKDKKFFDESIPVLKPVPGIVEENDKAQKTASDVPQVEILPLVRVEKILVSGMPTTKFKILKVPYHATWRQNLVDIQ